MANDNIRARRAEEKPRLYVRLPRELTTHPPIQHRGGRDPAKLDVFEFVIAGTIASLADAELSNQQHAYSFRVGRKAINTSEQMVKRDYPNHPHPRSNNKSAGMDGYYRARKEFVAPDVVIITVSARRLFRAAGLSLKGLTRLPALLPRLAEQRVGRLPPLLRGISKADNGRWVLDVDTSWIRPPYSTVPWPPPTQQGGATTLSLYLFLSGIDRRDDLAAIRAETLCEYLGIPTGDGRNPKRDLDQAFARANKHLHKLNKDGALDKLNEEDVRLSDKHLLLPTAFELLPRRKGNFIHFRAIDVRAEAIAEEERAERAYAERRADEERRAREQCNDRRSQQEWDDRAYFGAMAKKLRGER